MPHADTLIHATGTGLTPRQDALLRANDDLHRSDAALADARKEIARLERERDRLQAKLDRHAAARTPEALAARVLQISEYHWRVPSDTADGGGRDVIYMPRVERYSCDCKYNIHRGTCRHVAAVSLANRPRGAATDRADSRHAHETEAEA